VHTTVSEEHTASIFRAEDGSNMYLPTSPHGVTAKKTNIDIFNAVRTSNLINFIYIPPTGKLYKAVRPKVSNSKISYCESY
jgi:hypothetical protein